MTLECDGLTFDLTLRITSKVRFKVRTVLLERLADTESPITDVDLHVSWLACLLSSLRKITLDLALSFFIELLARELQSGQ